jgi:hypothetical protein
MAAALVGKGEVQFERGWRAKATESFKKAKDLAAAIGHRAIFLEAEKGLVRCGDEPIEFMAARDGYACAPFLTSSSHVPSTKKRSWLCCKSSGRYPMRIV